MLCRLYSIRSCNWNIFRFNCSICHLFDWLIGNIYTCIFGSFYLLRLFFSFSLLLSLRICVGRFGSKISDRKSDEWNNWRAWGAAHFSAVHEKCADFQWICRRAASTKLASRTSAMRVNSNSATVARHFIRMATRHSFRDTVQSDQCHSTHQVSEIIFNWLSEFWAIVKRGNNSIRFKFPRQNSWLFFAVI